MKQGLLLLGCLVAAAGCKQAPPTQMETGYEVMTVSPTDRMISSAYSATIRGRQDIDIYPGRRYADKSQCHRRTAGEERTDAVHHRPSAV